jgi:hypothetical protein
MHNFSAKGVATVQLLPQIAGIAAAAASCCSAKNWRAGIKDPDALSPNAGKAGTAFHALFATLSTVRKAGIVRAVSRAHNFAALAAAVQSTRAIFAGDPLRHAGRRGPMPARNRERSGERRWIAGCWATGWKFRRWALAA